MAAPDPKIAALLLGMPKGKSSNSDDDEDIDMGKSRRLDAAEAVLKAVKSGDAEALDSALHEHYQACEGAEEESSED